MKRTGYEQKQYRERSDWYILFLAGIYNLVFVDISLDGMPLRTLILLLADFLCITVYIYKREIALPRWGKCSAFEKTMAVLLVTAAAAVAFLAVSESDHFWAGVDIIALLLVYPCICGRKRFPQDLFGVYSVCSSVICILLIACHLSGGVGEPLVALLLKDDAAVSWLVLGITMNFIAYCYQENGQLWYGCHILLNAFLLAVQKNVSGLAVAALVPLMIPIFCRPSKAVVGRAAQAELMYAFLVCNMSLITGYTPLAGKIPSYDLEISVYMELLMAVMGVWFFEHWDRHTRDVEQDATVPEMRAWCQKAVVACLVGGAGILAAAELFVTEKAPAWNRVAQIIVNDIGGTSGWQSGLFGQMGQRFGIWGVVAACVFFYTGIMWIGRTKRWRVRAHKLYRLIAAVCLLQASLLPQTMVSLPVYAAFFILFMQTQDQIQRTDAGCQTHENGGTRCIGIQIDIVETDQEKGENTDEADYSDPMLQ